ncbi:phosphoglycerate kinase [Candidatus Berkiella aquae]|uniref:Phosphoglycerate kinase n=1 Tax=Candidatus Berkiella aquae TaxID=295108 RepID=A0A0Q9YZL5_9GAMM|nr:phosphoglycerate kinase [Candidatus Berkiella aquae]MCS5712583.1 phosphoglycerate kinase [Candidatus Berkiella aquae]
MQKMAEIALAGKTVLIREDFNVPMQDGKITHSARIEAALPTLRMALAQGAKVIVMSHLGRPVEGQFDAQYSLKPVADYLEKALEQPVPLFDIDHVPNLQPSQIALLENVRFLEGEEKNAPLLAKRLAALCDIFVMDAFAVAHRAQASTVGVAEYARAVCAGPLLQKELQALNKIFDHPQKPVLAIVGGSKVSTKLQVLTNMLDKVDILVLGGGIANTFLKAKGLPVGDSLYEPDLVPTAQELLLKAQRLGKIIWLPEDVVVSDTMDKQAKTTTKLVNEVSAGDKIFDIGTLARESLLNTIQSAKTILWNGPVGVFELEPFAMGTQTLAEAIAMSPAFSVAGGGDTLAAIEQFQVSEKISYLSTGGGAFLEALEGITLPAVAILEERSKELMV